jgi:hypothetical protein
MSEDKQISRRTALKAGMTVLAGGLAAKSASAADLDSGKMAKSVVQYRYHPAANGSHCAICANFLAPGVPGNATTDARCKLVAGVIDPNGYCLAFAKKKA